MHTFLHRHSFLKQRKFKMRRPAEDAPLFTDRTTIIRNASENQKNSENSADRLKAICSGDFVFDKIKNHRLFKIADLGALIFLFLNAEEMRIATQVSALFYAYRNLDLYPKKNHLGQFRLLKDFYFSAVVSKDVNPYGHDFRPIMRESQYPNTSRLISSNTHKTDEHPICVFDNKTGALLQALPRQQIEKVVLHPNGHHLIAMPFEDTEFKIFDIFTGACVKLSACDYSTYLED